MLSKSEITSNLDAIQQQFLSSQKVNAKNTKFRVSKKGNLVVSNKTNNTVSVYEVDQPVSNTYIFTELIAPANNISPKPKKISSLTAEEKDVVKNAFLKKFRLFNNDDYEVSFDTKLRIIVEENTTGRKNKYRVKRGSSKLNFSFTPVNTQITEVKSSEARQIVAAFFKQNPQLNIPDIHASVSSDSLLNLNYIPDNIVVSYSICFSEDKGHCFSLQKRFNDAFSVIEDAIAFEKHKDDVSQKACELVSRNWPFADGRVEVCNFSFKTTKFSAQIHWGKNHENISINRKDYRDDALSPEQNANHLAELFVRRVEVLVDNALPQRVIDSISRAVKKQNAPAVNFGATVKKLLSMQLPYSGHEILFAIGSSDKGSINSIRRQTNSTQLNYEYDSKNKLFVANTKIYTYYITPESYTVTNIEINKDTVNKIKASAEVHKKSIPYYSLAFSFIDSIKETGCNIRNISYDSDNEGVYYSDAVIELSYNRHSFSVNVSIPHLPYENEKECKAKVKSTFKSILKSVSNKVLEIDNELDGYRRNNLDLYQSYAAQTIYDFVNTETSSCSITRITDLLTKKNYNGYCSPKSKKYIGILHEYSKDYIKSVVDKLEAADLLRSFLKRGDYTDYYAYKTNQHCKEYKLYFNNKVRPKKDIINDLKSGIGVPRYEACFILNLIKEGKIKEKDFIYIFNIFKNHDFVIQNQKDIIDAFSGVSQNVKLYIPFVVDEYPRASIERKVLKNIHS